MICVGGCCGDLTEDFQPDPSARVVGSGAVGSQAVSRNECDELGATIESGGVYGELACVFAQLFVATCVPCVARFAYVFKRKTICGVLFLRHNLHIIKCTNPNEFLLMHTFDVCNHLL